MSFVFLLFERMFAPSNSHGSLFKRGLTPSDPHRLVTTPFGNRVNCFGSPRNFFHFFNFSQKRKPGNFFSFSSVFVFSYSLFSILSLGSQPRFPVFVSRICSLACLGSLSWFPIFVAYLGSLSTEPRLETLILLQHG